MDRTKETQEGADFLQLRRAAAPATGLTGWLVDAVRAAIADGRLRPGARLPATRVLAADLRLSRGVVVEAYRRLAEEGLVSGRAGGGTRVTAMPAVEPWEPRGTGAAGAPAPGSLVPGPAVRLGGSPVQGPSTRPGGSPVPGPSTGPGSSPAPGPSVRLGGAPAGGGPGGGLRLPLGVFAPAVDIDLSPGLPDLSAFPRTAWLRAERQVLGATPAAEFAYGDPRGSLVLRRELVGWLGRVRGVRAGPEDILVVGGVAQSLALVAQALRARGVTEAAVEDPGSRGVVDTLEYWGVRPVPVPVDEHGLDVGALTRTGVPAALLTPAHQFPTGVVLAPERRRELLAWAAAGGLVVEDDYDAEHRYDRAPVPALQASAPDRVVHTGSVSKTLAPGFRLGWLIAPRWLQDELVAAKHASDLGSPVLPQLVLARLIAGGDLDRHLRLTRSRYRARRDAFLSALTALLPSARVQGIAAGLHLLITFPEAAGTVADTELADRVRAAGVLTHPLSWHRRLPGPPGLVVGYAAHPPDRLREAARRLARTVDRIRSAPPRRPGRGG
ncbi:PLP-dependent aminotransferase family protein [Streptomyces tritici]|uniref:aminotransferase-like domain-containing protein n=1 Tax=Streptomyces tritici TaxID=2054410 RepID=UPI003AEFF791